MSFGSIIGQPPASESPPPAKRVQARIPAKDGTGWWACQNADCSPTCPHEAVSKADIAADAVWTYPLPMAAQNPNPIPDGDHRSVDATLGDEVNAAHPKDGA